MRAETITTPRLLLLPFTKEICTGVLGGNHEALARIGISPSEGWPDEETLDTLPRIMKNLELVEEPTGFESWMIVKQAGRVLIGDAGFKGRPNAAGEIDLGYGIIASEQNKGYGLEAAQGLVNWARLRPEVKTITARCALDNIGSARILEKMDFQEITRDQEMIYWVLPKE
ncbi:GNAT family N-acetyltransferase [Rufibacter psychrotolerans]|uniref:GNAT family N-acetyltransferase n=1 Tax=Rufibacter psychrotolerans TaxID=2812556 RepID=UPI001967C6A2|nr:GNAT family N-acetyltransferase [Rufibacter sp. SYSU D00308]